MIAKETSIDGIRPPPAPTQSSPAVVVATSPSIVQAQLQVCFLIQHFRFKP